MKILKMITQKTENLKKVAKEKLKNNNKKKKKDEPKKK